MIDPYGAVFRRFLHPAWESGIRGRPTLRLLHRLERTQWSSEDALREIQGRELRRLLTHAWDNNAYYRRRFEAAGVHPTDVRGVEDLPKLPLLTREDALETRSERESSAAPFPVIRKKTSGSTGRPLQFAYDRVSEFWRQATKLRGYGWADYHAGDRSLHFWGHVNSVRTPGRMHRAKEGLDRLIRREHYFDCTDRSETALAEVVRHIVRLSPSVIVCYAQAGAALARHVVETKSRAWKDIAIISAAERLFPTDRAVMTEAFGPRIFETYGSREVMLIAAECPAHDGLHVSMENLVLEIVVREGSSERPARPGETGEVVITDLHNFGAPFIRYLTGDLAVRVSGGRCACGRALDRLRAVEGRTADTLHDGAGRPVSGLFFSVLFSALAQGVRGFQVVQRKDRSIDLLLVPGAAFDDSLLEAVKKSCHQAIPGVPLRTQLVPRIPIAPSGKLSVVVVER